VDQGRAERSADFRKAVAPQWRYSGEKSTKSFVFVHGLTANFQEVAVPARPSVQADIKSPTEFPIRFSWPSARSGSCLWLNWTSNRQAIRRADYLIGLTGQCRRQQAVATVGRHWSGCPHCMGLPMSDPLTALRQASYRKVYGTLGSDRPG